MLRPEHNQYLRDYMRKESDIKKLHAAIDVLYLNGLASVANTLTDIRNKMSAEKEEHPITKLLMEHVTIKPK